MLVNKVNTLLNFEVLCCVYDYFYHYSLFLSKATIYIHMCRNVFRYGSMRVLRHKLNLSCNKLLLFNFIPVGNRK